MDEVEAFLAEWRGEYLYYCEKYGVEPLPWSEDWTSHLERLEAFDLLVEKQTLQGELDE